MCSLTKLIKFKQISADKSSKKSTTTIFSNASTSNSSLQEDRTNGNILIDPRDINTGDSDGSQAYFSTTFDLILDKVWMLLRAHPLREVQTMAVLMLLQARFPIYNRLAADLRLVRLVDSYLDGGAGPSPSSSDYSGGFFGAVSSTSNSRKLVDMTLRDRHTYIRASRVGMTTSRVRALRQKCDQILASDRLRFYSECGHYEKCVVEAGPARKDFKALRNKLRKCSRCATINGRPRINWLLIEIRIFYRSIIRILSVYISVLLPIFDAILKLRTTTKM